jgi:hypothetical protein
MAVILVVIEQSKSIYVPVGITGSYFANRFDQANS